MVLSVCGISRSYYMTRLIHIYFRDRGDKTYIYEAVVGRAQDDKGYKTKISFKFGKLFYFCRTSEWNADAMGYERREDARVWHEKKRDTDNIKRLRWVT